MIKILKCEETNPFCNPRFANNGGGYSQPFYKFEYKGIKGTLHDTSCGDFGERYLLKWGDKFWRYSNVEGDVSIDQTNLDKEKDADFIEAIEEAFGIRVFKILTPRYCKWLAQRWQWNKKHILVWDGDSLIWDGDLHECLVHFGFEPELYKAIFNTEWLSDHPDDTNARGIVENSKYKIKFKEELQ